MVDWSGSREREAAKRQRRQRGRERERRGASRVQARKGCTAKCAGEQEAQVNKRGNNVSCVGETLTAQGKLISFSLFSLSPADESSSSAHMYV